MSCQCKVVGDETIVCDECASRQIEALNASTADFVELVPGMLRGPEQSNLLEGVNDWLEGLGSCWS